VFHCGQNLLLAGTETAARCSWLDNPNLSCAGKEEVAV